MSTPDDFESEGGDVATVGGTNPKYYQVAVPNFPFGGTTPVPAVGSSFVRLGSFPPSPRRSRGSRTASPSPS